MSFITPLVCDRRIYDKKGKWFNPLKGLDDNIFYFIKEPATLVASYVNGREELKETLTITIYGGKQIAKEDIITLENDTKYKVVGITVKYFESNILVKDLVKPRIAEMDLILE